MDEVRFNRLYTVVPIETACSGFLPAIVQSFNHHMKGAFTAAEVRIVEVMWAPFLTACF
jgi:hypothetical protein